MTGAALKDLVAASGITLAELSRELTITPKAVADTLQAKRLRVATEERYLTVVARLIREKAALRERLRVEAALGEIPSLEALCA
ncbi:hypothetical protein EPN29_01935 [bacterium]|nr:MAG: hypothetical protein EPN29_01935 [bacterium]